MKKCIVCKRSHDRPDLFCEEHADLPNSVKLDWYKKYDYLVQNSTAVVDASKYALIVMVPEKDASGKVDKTLAKIYLNGKEMRIEPPLYVKIDEKMMVDMKVSF